MKILTTSQVREADDYTITNEPIESIDLMERASGKCVEWLTKNFDHSTEFVVFAGPGNNGGDGLAIARLLAEQGYRAKIYIIRITDRFSKDFTTNINMRITVRGSLGSGILKILKKKQKMF